MNLGQSFSLRSWRSQREEGLATGFTASLAKRAEDAKEEPRSEFLSALLAILARGRVRNLIDFNSRMSRAIRQPFGLVGLPEDAKEDPRSEVLSSSLAIFARGCSWELALQHLSQSAQRAPRQPLDQLAFSAFLAVLARGSRGRPA